MDVTENDVKEILESIVSRDIADLLALDEAGLESRWYFRYDHALSVGWNIYVFSGCLESFKRNCRRWEEHHNGHSCVVERVRDKYLMPKIHDFEREMRKVLK